MRIKPIMMYMLASGVCFTTLGACSSSGGGGGGGNNPAPPGPAGTLQIAEISYDAPEGTVVNIFVNRSGGDSGVVSVDYATADGTAIAGADYPAMNGTFTYADGVSGNQTISIPITDDNAAEGPESFTVTLSNVSRATLGANSSATVNIIDNDVAVTGDGFARGIISGFGSVIVGGTHHVVAGTTTITVDDNPSSTENDLEIGDYVEIRSTFNDDGTTTTFTADSIEAVESVEGPVDLLASIIDGPDTGTLQVLGQTVRVTPVTILDNADFDADGLTDLLDGDYIEAHGLRRPDGSVDASQIERKNPLVTDVIELTGIISSAAPASDSFTINGLTVTYTLAGLQDFPGGREPEVGDLVEAKGTPAGLTAGPTLAADSVELKTRGLAGADDDRAEVEGFIEGCNGPPCDSFSIDGVDVQLASSVTYEPVSLGQADLSNAIKIEAEGRFSGGILIANKIEFKPDNNSRVEATVDSNSSNMMVLLGVTFNYDPATTEFRDQSGSPVGDITLVTAGHYVEARGDEDPPDSNMVEADDVRRDDPPGDGRMIIRGIADSKSSTPSLDVSVLGVTVALTGSTQCRNLDDDLYSGGCAVFVDDVKPGITTVKARGVSFSGGTLTAEEIELEN
ncbi:MAG: DUF5666 domain-containing protein [Gammaproteobacteria bacterium]|nr:DUF5666 domain-containing protein [Gammaproteobacteria bacterium]